MVSSARKNAPNTIWMPSPSAGDEQGGLVRSPESAEPVRRPLHCDRHEADDRSERERATDDQAALEA